MSDPRRATRWRAPDEPCLNCGDTTTGKYCPTCGQRKTEVLVSVRAMLADVLEDQLVLNRALPRTISSLLLRPGFLTEEYVRGRIVRYIAPFRLYLVTSVIFFLIVSFVGLGALDVNVTDNRSAVAADSAADSSPDTPTVADGAAAGDTVPAVAAQQTAADSAAPSDSEALDTGAPLTPGTMQRWARELQFDDSAPLFRRAIGRKIAQVGHLPLQDALRELLGDLLEYAPHMVFVLLPFFALLLKLLYVRRTRYYAEHFVFALHVHAFFFTMFTLIFLLPWWGDLVLWVWMMLYVWLAMKRVYRQGWFRTTVKWWTLGWLYSFVVTFGVIGLALVTLLLT